MVDHFIIMYIAVISRTVFVCVFGRNEKDNQGENMFMRCVSELVIESREVGCCCASEVRQFVFYRLYDFSKILNLPFPFTV